MPIPRLADVGLVLLATGVLTGAGYVVTRDPAPPRNAALTVSPSPEVTPTPTPSPTPSPSGTPGPTAPGTVLLVGHHLAAWKSPLEGLGWDVLTAEPGADTVLAEGTLTAVPGTPAVVALEVTPGTQTTPRARDAVVAVQAAFPGAAIVLVGPFDASAHHSAAAVKTAAAEEGVGFLDPVEEGWLGAVVPDQLADRLIAAGR